MKSILDNRNYYTIDYHTKDLTKGHLNVMIWEDGWWVAFDDLATNAENYIDNLVEFIKNEIFDLQTKGTIHG